MESPSAKFRNHGDDAFWKNVIDTMAGSAAGTIIGNPETCPARMIMVADALLIAYQQRKPNGSDKA